MPKPLHQKINKRILRLELSPGAHDPNRTVLPKICEYCRFRDVFRKVSRCDARGPSRESCNDLGRDKVWKVIRTDKSSAR